MTSEPAMRFYRRPALGTAKASPCLALVAVSLLCAFWQLGCTEPEKPAKKPKKIPPPPAEARDVFDEYLWTEVPPADGFDFPVGNEDGKGQYTDRATGHKHGGWYVAAKFGEEYSLGIHPGEDWNGSGGGDTDLGQQVFSIGNGRVLTAENFGSLWGNVITIEHAFYENYEKRKVVSLYAHLEEIWIKKGDHVAKRQVIGSIGRDPDGYYSPHLHLEIRRDDSLSPTYWPSSNGRDRAWVQEHYTSPSEFIKSHRVAPVPRREETLILVDHESYKMRLYKRGEKQGEYDISLGQGMGPKESQGDDKTPKGMYFVIQKYRGEFTGPFKDFYA